SAWWRPTSRRGWEPKRSRPSSRKPSRPPAPPVPGSWGRSWDTSGGRPRGGSTARWSRRRFAADSPEPAGPPRRPLRRGGAGAGPGPVPAHHDGHRGPGGRLAATRRVLTQDDAVLLVTHLLVDHGDFEPRRL